MLTCPICGDSFKERKGFSNHLTRMHKSLSFMEKEEILVKTIFGSDEVEKVLNGYINFEYPFYQLPIDIRKYITLLGKKRSSKEERASQRYKDKYNSSIKNKYGVENISQAKFVKEKKKNTAKVNYGSWEAYLSKCREHMRLGFEEYLRSDERKKEQQQKSKQTLQNLYGVDNAAQLPHVRKIISQKAKERLSKLSEDELRELTAPARESVCSRGGYSSKPEHRVRAALADIGLSFFTNKNLWSYNWDIVFEDLKLLIEVNGDYWHANPSFYKKGDMISYPGGLRAVEDVWKKDARKAKKAKSKGWRLLVVWEADIVSKTDRELLFFIEEKLKEIIESENCKS